MRNRPALSLWRPWLAAPALAVLLLALGAGTVAADGQAVGRFRRLAPAGAALPLDPSVLLAAAAGRRRGLLPRPGPALPARAGPRRGAPGRRRRPLLRHPGQRRLRGRLRRRTLQPLLAPLGPLVAWLAQVVSGFLPEKQIERIRGNLTVAGLPYSRHLAQFLAAKAGLAVGLALVAGLYQARAGAPSAMRAALRRPRRRPRLLPPRRLARPADAPAPGGGGEGPAGRPRPAHHQRRRRAWASTGRCWR